MHFGSSNSTVGFVNEAAAVPHLSSSSHTLCKAGSAHHGWHMQRTTKLVHPPGHHLNLTQGGSGSAGLRAPTAALPAHPHLRAAGPAGPAVPPREGRALPPPRPPRVLKWWSPPSPPSPFPPAPPRSPSLPAAPDPRGGGGKQPPLRPGPGSAGIRRQARASPGKTVPPLPPGRPRRAAPYLLTSPGRGQRCPPRRRRGPPPWAAGRCLPAARGAAGSRGVKEKRRVSGQSSSQHVSGLCLSSSRPQRSQDYVLRRQINVNELNTWIQKKLSWMQVEKLSRVLPRKFKQANKTSDWQRQRLLLEARGTELIFAEDEDVLIRHLSLRAGVSKNQQFHSRDFCSLSSGRPLLHHGSTCNRSSAAALF
ncbi:uncharacterized protein FN964_000505 [Alca torda]